MKKKMRISLVCGILALVVVSFVIFIVFFKVNKDDNAMTIIEGVDGPTSVFLAGKLGGNNTADSSYKQISQEEAKIIMDDGVTDYVLVDVRTMEEYKESHISGAVCIPNESIVDEQPKELPDKNKLILVYCRSGRRSKEAAAKLANMGYTDVREFGGIIDWKHETTAE